jgi:hypothetical protein
MEICETNHNSNIIKSCRALALYVTSIECVWLISLIQHIQENCGLSTERINATIIYEDNNACIAQLKEGYIKDDRTKYISAKFFFTHDLQKNGDINIHQIRSCDNLAEIFTKVLPSRTFEQLIQKIGLRRLRDDCMVEGRNKYIM